MSNSAGIRIISWWGTLAGGVLGYLLDGSIGIVLLGLFVGHQVSISISVLRKKRKRRRMRWAHALKEEDPTRVQRAFFSTTFSVMGHLCKADGRVSEDEIAFAYRVMGQMELASSQRQEAIRFFTQGKQADFPLQDVLLRLQRECRGQPGLIRMFIEIQLHAAYADGVLHDAEKGLLNHLCRVLHFPRAEFGRLEASIRMERQRPGSRAQSNPEQPVLHRTLSRDPYALLGVAADASNEAVKKAYRRLLSQHHPDKLAARGASEEVMKLAAAKTHEIRRAYEQIREARGA